MLKRDLRLFLRCLMPAVVLTVVFAAVCAAAALAAVKGSEGAYTPVKAAVVDSEESVLSRMLIRGVMGTDYIAPLMDVSTADFDEAMEDLEAGELSAVIVLPKNFIGDITSGQSTAGQIYLSDAAAAHADTVAGAARFGELLLASGQYGIFAGERLVWRHELGGEFHSEFLARTNPALLDEVMGAESEYFTDEVTDYGDTSMSTVSYYAMSWLTLLLMLCAMFFSRLYAADMTRPMLCRLHSTGIGTAPFLWGKLLFPFLFRVVLLIPVLLLLSMVIPMEAGVLSVGGVLICAAAAAVIGAALAMGLDQGLPTIAVVSILGLFLCGGIIPRQMLPQGLLTLGSVTPFGALQVFLAPLFGGTFSPLSAVAAVIYLVVSPLLIFRRIRRLCVGGEAE